MYPCPRVSSTTSFWLGSARALLTTSHAVSSCCGYPSVQVLVLWLEESLHSTTTTTFKIAAWNDAPCGKLPGTLQFTRNGWSYVPIEEDGVAHEITVACIYGQGSQQTCRSSTSVRQETRSQVVGLAIFLPNPSRGDGDAAAERRAKVTLDRDRPEDVAPTTQTQQ